MPKGGSDSWQLYSLGFKWTTGVGELVSSTSYFDRKVVESEDETDFIWAALLPLVTAIPAYPNISGYPAGRLSPTTGLPLPIPSAISEDQGLSALRRRKSGLPLSFPARCSSSRGAFYSDLHGALPFAANYPPALAPGYGAQINASGICSIPVICANPNNPDEIFGQNYNTSIKEPAVYGQLSYEFLSKWKATAGLRWNQVKTTAGGYLEGTVTQAPGAPGRIIDPNTTTTENSTTPKAELAYQVNPADMIYASAAKGFRPGGLVPSVPAALCGSELPDGIDGPGDSRL